MSIPMVAILFLVGMWISGIIESHIDDKNAEYYSAVQITEPDIFQFNMQTNVGNAFVYGVLEAVDTVSYPDIQGEFMSLRKVTEMYTMHTRVVTTTDSMDGAIHVLKCIIAGIMLERKKSIRRNCNSWEVNLTFQNSIYQLKIT